MMFACPFVSKLMRCVLLFWFKLPLNVRRGSNHRQEELDDAGGMVTTMSSYACWELRLMSHQNQNRSSQLMTVASKFLSQAKFASLCSVRPTLLIFEVDTLFMSLQLPTIVEK